MDLEVRVDSDEVRVECRVMGLREGNAVLHYRLPKPLVLVFDDMSRIEQHRLVMDVFAGEIGGSIHALSVKTQTP